MDLKEIEDKELLEKYFSLTLEYCSDTWDKFSKGLGDAKLDKLFEVEEEILRRMKNE
ncbi:MAG: hypothetical protein ACLR02_11205 [Clostridium sp.]